LASPVFFFCIILLNHSLVFVILLTLRSYTQSRNIVNRALYTYKTARQKIKSLWLALTSNAV